MGLIGKLYKKIALISPWVEVILRKIYWKNVKILKRFKPYNTATNKTRFENYHVNFEEIIQYLKSKGIGRGSLLIIHSSYDVLSCTGLTPNDIISRLRELVGDEGTIAMPAIRYFKEEPLPEDLLKIDKVDVICEYNVLRTPIISGILPFTLLRLKESVCSHFPLNPLVAIGPLAKPMMEHNIDNDNCSAHGKESCWKFCLDHNAIILGLGVDLDHHNTMLHVMEEAYDNWYWPNDDWYNLREFDLVDENKKVKRIKVRERKAIWGMLYNAEVRMYKDFYKYGIIERKDFGPIPVCYEEALKLKEHLQKRNQKGYPYYKF